MENNKKKSHLEWLAEKEFNLFKYKNPIVPENHLNPFKLGMVKGYQIAEKELPTWDDVTKAIAMARETEYGFIKSKEEIIEQLKQVK